MYLKLFLAAYMISHVEIVFYIVNGGDVVQVRFKPIFDSPKFSGQIRTKKLLKNKIEWKCTKLDHFL